MKLSLVFGAFLILGIPALGACSVAAESDAIGQAESANTADGGDGGEGGASEAGAPSVVAPYEHERLPGVAKVRVSVDGAPAVEAVDVALNIVPGVDRRFQLTATMTAAPRSGAYLEFGSGASLIAPGTYGCAALEAVLVFVEPDGTRKMTVATGAPSRPCTVTIDEVSTFEFTPAELTGISRSSVEALKRARRVRGRFEATVGLREDPASPTRSVRGAFRDTFRDPAQL